MWDSLDRVEQGLVDGGLGLSLVLSVLLALLALLNRQSFFQGPRLFSAKKIQFSIFSE